MKCNRCGSIIQNEQNKFCPYCGAALQPKKGKKIKILIPVLVCLVVLVVAAVVLFSVFFNKAPVIEAGAAVGDIIEFGSYEQDNNTSNGKEPIEWIILEKQEGKALVISSCCLDYAPYHEDDTAITWENSALREWLNGEFAEEAFSNSERAKIITQKNDNPGLYLGTDADGKWIVTNREEDVSEVLYQSPASKATEDQVFLLTVDEAVEYMGSGTMGYSSLTAFSKEKFIQASMEMARETGFTDEDLLRERYKGLEEEYGEGCCFWWLRSPGYSEDTAAVIVYSGEVVQAQNVEEMAAIRPAIWLQID